MPSPQIDYITYLATSVPVVSTAETVIATSRTFNSSYPGCQIGVEFMGQFTVASDQTSLVYKIRRDSLTGTAVYTSGARTVVAAALVGISVAVVDQPGDIASGVYVLTVAQAGGTANGAAALMFSRITVGS